MNNKYIYLLLVVLLNSVTLNAQNFFEDNNPTENNENEFYEDMDMDEEPEGIDFPGPPRAPINDYLPLLAVAAVGLGFYYRKDLIQITKSK